MQKLRKVKVLVCSCLSGGLSLAVFPQNLEGLKMHSAVMALSTAWLYAVRKDNGCSRGLGVCCVPLGQGYVVSCQRLHLVDLIDAGQGRHI